MDSAAVDAYVFRLERNLMTGSARWVADFTESFRNYQVQDVLFDMVVTGGMRVRSGLFFSRLFSFLALPNYQTACFVYCARVEPGILRKLLRAIQSHMETHALRWTWLVLPREGPFPDKVQRMVEKLDSPEIGVALVDVASGEVLTSRSYLGQRMKAHVRCFP
ncbi:MAG: hypothetical protein ACUVXG_09630 [Anaerolineae bacterium]